MPSTGAAMGAMAMGDMGSMGAMGGLAVAWLQGTRTGVRFWLGTQTE